jgi:hypothetical protein
VSLAVLELNDAALLLGDADGVRARSPAFALLAADAPVMGEAARSTARIDPRRTLSQFWQRLGTEPLHHAPAHTRHHADLGYRHLLHVHELGGKPAELLLAVPGSFTREQLALLLGIAERCPFHACGLVDSALAAAATVPLSGPAIHLELQLHQAVLTRIEHEQGTLSRGTVRTLPGTGLSALQDRWARRAAEAFIQQCRFDPLHAAASEQALYDRLPGWLDALAVQESVEAEIRQEEHRHRATLRAADMLDAAQAIYTDLLEALAREGGGASLLLGARVAGLPRFAARVPEAHCLEEDASLRGALRNVDRVRSEERALRFVTRLPARSAAEPPAGANTAIGAGMLAAAHAPEPARALPATHLVAGSQALRLQGERLHLLGNTAEGWRLSRTVSAGSRCGLEQLNGDWHVSPASGVLLRIDGLPVPARVQVRAGSRLGIEDETLVFVAEVSADSDAA